MKSSHHFPFFFFSGKRFICFLVVLLANSCATLGLVANNSRCWALLLNGIFLPPQSYLVPIGDRRLRYGHPAGRLRRIIWLSRVFPSKVTNQCYGVLILAHEPANRPHKDQLALIGVYPMPATSARTIKPFEVDVGL